MTVLMRHSGMAESDESCSLEIFCHWADAASIGKGSASQVAEHHAPRLPDGSISAALSSPRSGNHDHRETAKRQRSALANMQLTDCAVAGKKVTGSRNWTPRWRNGGVTFNDV